MSGFSATVFGFVIYSNQEKKKLSYCRDSARCRCRSTQPKSIIWPKSSVQPTSIQFTHALLIYHYWHLMLRLVCTSIHHLSSRWNWKKMIGKRWTCFGVRVPGTLDYPSVNLNPPWSSPYDHNARPSQTDRRTDRRTDEHLLLPLRVGLLREDRRTAAE